MPGRSIYQGRNAVAAALALMLAGCADLRSAVAPTALDPQLAGAWRLEHNPFSSPVAVIFKDGDLSGQTGCLAFDIPIEARDGHLRHVEKDGVVNSYVSDGPCRLYETRSARAWDFWHHVGDVIFHATGYRIEGDRLVLRADGGDRLVFRRDP